MLAKGATGRSCDWLTRHLLRAHNIAYYIEPSNDLPKIQPYACTQPAVV